MSDDTSRFLPLKPDTFEILLALSEGDLHGYAILKVLEARGVQVAASLLYRKVRRLLEDDLIVAVKARPAQAGEDERRRYYRLTRLGSAVVQAEASRIVGLARSQQVRRLAQRANHA